MASFENDCMIFIGDLSPDGMAVDGNLVPAFTWNAEAWVLAVLIRMVSISILISYHSIVSS
jgi:hypothetical protein